MNRSAGDPRIGAAFGGALMGSVLADCVYAVRAGAIPTHDVSSAFMIAAAAVIVALASGAPGKVVAGAAAWGALVVLDSAVVAAYDDNPRLRSSALTMLFVGAGLFLVPAATTRGAGVIVALGALAGAALRWVLL